MGKQYKYRHTELYKDVQIDIKANSTTELIEKVLKQKDKIDRRFIDPTTPLKDFARQYLETYKKNAVSADWYTNLEHLAYSIIVPGIGNKPIGKIKVIQVQEFLNGCSGYSEEYIKKIFQLTSQIFKEAYKNGVTDKDYTLHLVMPQGRKGEERRSITDYERKIMLLVLDGHITEDYHKTKEYVTDPTPHYGSIMCKLILYCGVRPGEATALIWKDIDLKNGVLDINKARKKTGSIGAPKNNKFRKIPIPAHFLPELKTNQGGPFDLVCTKFGSPYTEQRKKSMWNNVRRLMNIGMGCKVYRNQLIDPLPLAEDYVMYNLRHTYCTDLEKAGVPINIACRFMGHSDISVTSKIYTHASTEALETARLLIDRKI